MVAENLAFGCTMGLYCGGIELDVRCVGRQPWTVYGEIRTVDAASQLPASNVLTSLTAFAVVYSLLFVFALYFGSRIIRLGPNFDLSVPGEEVTEDLDITPAEHLPDSRPVEAQQSNFTG